MFFCSQCGNAVEEGSKFCNKCGAPVSTPAPAPTPAAPVYTAPVEQSAPYPAPYPVPVTTVAPVRNETVISGKEKAMGFVGMGVSIGGLVMAVLGIIYTMLGMSLEGMGFYFSLIFGLFSTPMGFVGRSLCTKSAARGNTMSSCSVGTKIGLAAIIVSFVMIGLGLISLAAV